MRLIPRAIAIGLLLISLWGCGHTMSAKLKSTALASQQPTSTVTLQLEAAPVEVSIGEEVVFTFQVAHDGYVSLWDIGTSGRIQRVYPLNAKAVYVQAGRRYRAGEGLMPFAFQASGPEGLEQVYLIWTPSFERHPEDIPDGLLGRTAKSEQWTERHEQRNIAIAQVTLTVASKSKPSQQPVLIKTKALYDGDAHLLALGANVEGLTKTDLDVRSFAEHFKTIFPVSDDHVHLYENAYKRHFYEGMQKLQTSVKPGDLVVILYSGHGTYITDDSGDEKDGLDEAFVMYDAVGAPGISLAHLIRDDDFAASIETLPTERVLVFLDACFSSQLVKDLPMTADLGSALTGARTKRLSSKSFLGDIWKAALRPLESWTSDPEMDRPPSKGLYYTAAQGREYAYEVEEGGLFITTFLDQLRQTSSGNFNSVFRETAVRVRHRSGGRQSPQELGNISLGAELQLAPLTLPMHSHIESVSDSRRR